MAANPATLPRRRPPGSAHSTCHLESLLRLVERVAKEEFAIRALNTYLLCMVSRTRPTDDGRSKTALKSELKENSVSRIERRDAEIALAMKQEAERRAGVVKNMHRLRALRLSQTPKT
jgi:hypothetical protein